jgi:type IV secretion system protein VirB10
MPNNESQTPPVVQNKTSLPPGVIPRNAQTLVIGGVAVIMALVIGFTGNNTAKEKPAKMQTISVTDPSQARIQEYRARIEEQARKLTQEQAQLAQIKASAVGLPEGDVAPAERQVYEYSRPPAYASAEAVPQKSWIEQDREKRTYESLYTSNIALSFRRDPVMSPLTPAPAPAAKRSGTKPEPDSEDDSESADEKKGHEEINHALGSTYRLFEGTVLETVLTNRLDGAFSGPVNCMVTADIYSHNGQHVLIPQGSRVLGEAKRVDAFGQERLAVAFHRLVMPDGYTTSLDHFRGLNQIGETGLNDLVNHHYLQIFGVSIAIGAIAGLSQANTGYGTTASAADAYRQGVASSLSQSSLRILDRYLNVLPTVTIREGQRVKVYLADDLLLPAYENHQMPNDL